MATRPIRAGGVTVALMLLAGLSACSTAQPSYVYAQPACYRTLGTVDCHSAALPGEETRRVGQHQAPLD